MNPLLISQLPPVIEKYKAKQQTEKQAQASTSTSLPSTSPVPSSSSHSSFPVGTSPVDKADILDRCVLLMINEAVYILTEGIAARAEDIDLAMIMGTGFAPYAGGLLNYADQRGLDNIVHRLVHFTHLYGDRFKPHPELIRMAKNGQRFFPNRPDIKKLTRITNLPRSKL